MNLRMQWCVWGDAGKRQRTSANNWHQPVLWNREAVNNLQCLVCGATGDEINTNQFCRQCELETYPIRPCVFCGSLCDWLDDRVPIEWLADLLALIHHTPNLTWILLTKRPQNWERRISHVIATSTEGSQRMAYEWMGCSNPPPNVWIGTTVEDQTRADERIPELLTIPAKVRFLSCEPLLGEIDLQHLGNVDGTDLSNGIQDALTALRVQWVICGGESGPKARPMRPEWARSLRDQCVSAGIPFFYKQDGGLRHGGNLLDGRTHEEFPV